MFIFTGRYYQSMLQETIHRTVQDNNEQISYGIETVLDDMINASFVINKDADIRTVLQSPNSTDMEYVNSIKKAEAVFTNMNNSILLKYHSPYIALFDTNGSFYTVPAMRIESDNARLLEALHTSDKPYIWFSSFDRYVRYNNLDEDDAQRISLARILAADGENDSAAILCVSLRSSDIFKNIRRLGSKFDSSFFILDKSGNTILQSGKALAGDFKKLIDAGRNNIFIEDAFGGRVFFSHFRISKTGWSIVQTIPYEVMFSKIDAVRNKTVLYTSLFLVIFVFILFLVLSMFTRPLKTVVKTMKKVQKGDLEQRIEVRTNDEIGSLAAAFNAMVREIKNLIDQNTCQQATLRNAELRALQAQINPHFLYNTLDSINWLAEMDGNKKISRMVTALSTFFKRALNKGREKISVEEEIQHAKSYLEIQKIRYEDKFSYHFNIEEEIMDREMIKLILQPLIENSIYHGIKLKRGKGNIIVTGEKSGDSLLFKVIDDGVGMGEDVLQELNDILMGKSVSGHGELSYGVKNVNERIKVTYGDNYGIRYISRKNEYTIAEIRIPDRNKAREGEADV